MTKKTSTAVKIDIHDHYNEEEGTIFLPYNVPSLKNSKIKTSFGLMESKAMRKWRKLVGPYCLVLKNTFLNLVKDKPKPYKIGLYFIRGTKHKWDFTNKSDSVQDLLVSHGWIEDDNADEMLPYPIELDGKFYHVDKSNPGVIIKIL